MTDYEGSAYGLSKACLNAYTALEARECPDLIVHSCSPGYILTDMTRDWGSATNPPDKGTRAPLHILLSEDLIDRPGYGVGWYWGSDAKRSPIDKYRDPGSPEYEGP
uniref:Uncharacterized protein n=1 Tax=Corethron hystrix TaxID=216773 RepID=A0A7S1FT16_9STRA